MFVFVCMRMCTCVVVFRISSDGSNHLLSLPPAAGTDFDTCTKNHDDNMRDKFLLFYLNYKKLNAINSHPNCLRHTTTGFFQACNMHSVCFTKYSWAFMLLYN